MVGAVAVSTLSGNFKTRSELDQVDVAEGWGVNDTIQFSSTLENLPIDLLLGQLNITRAVQIDGLGASLLTIDAGGGTDGVIGSFDGHTVFVISIASGAVEIIGLTLTGGDASLGAGAIFSGGDLIIRNTVVTGNAGSIFGGGIHATRNLTIENSTITSNQSSSDGGGIAFASNDDVVLTVIASTISGNHAVGRGGGIHASGDIATATIQSSHITGNTSQSHGGGISFDAQHLSLDSTELADNSVTSSGANGGGLHAQIGFFAAPGIISINASTFHNNQSSILGNGGGAYISVTAGSELTVSGTTFSDNKVFNLNSTVPGSASGGGLYTNASNAAVTITGTVASNNKALGLEANVGGVAIVATDNSNVVIDGLQATGNHADDDAGGLLIQNGDPEQSGAPSTAIVKNSIVSGNTASHNNSYNASSGVWLGTYNGGYTTLMRSTISNNYMTAISGSAVDVAGGGLFVLSDVGTTSRILNTTISGNTAHGNGGGIKVGSRNDGGQLLIQNSTITNNTADSDNNGVGTGGGIHVGSSTTIVTLENTIVARNFRSSESTRDDIGGAIAAEWSLIGDDSGATVTDNGGNQIGDSMSPVDPELGPLTNNGGSIVPGGFVLLTHMPQQGSPAINLGEPGASSLQFDQRGDPFDRVSGGRIDIGAVEVQPSDPACNLVGDYNRDGTVNAADYTVWRDRLGQEYTLSNEDPDFGPGEVEEGDYTVWKLHFGETCPPMAVGSGQLGESCGCSTLLAPDVALDVSLQTTAITDLALAAPAIIRSDALSDERAFVQRTRLPTANALKHSLDLLLASQKYQKRDTTEFRDAAYESYADIDSSCGLADDRARIFGTLG